jgi:hypothetical protein
MLFQCYVESSQTDYIYQPNDNVSGAALNEVFLFQINKTLFVWKRFTDY